MNPEKVKYELTREQEIKIIAFQDEIDGMLGGAGRYRTLVNDNAIQMCKPNVIKKIIEDMNMNSNEWGGLAHLNASDPRKWQRLLYKIAKFAGSVGTAHRDFVPFVCAISTNWHSTIPQLLARLASHGITIEKFFELERVVTFKLSAALANVNAIHNSVFQNIINISTFIANVSHAFLPKLVYELEEYGLPRMVSKKIQISGIIDLENKETPIHEILTKFNEIGIKKIKKAIPDIHPFEYYILDYFYDGIV